MIIKGDVEINKPSKYEAGGAKVGGITHTQCCMGQQGHKFPKDTPANILGQKSVAGLKGKS